ncbi:MAG: aminopeptidase P family protein [Candidatus Diapherotrites archaeon]|nr:aminopeptidase P family protein [Candidatus Diapherotrites archaeon]
MPLSEVFGKVDCMLFRNSENCADANFYYFSQLPKLHFNSDFLTVQKSGKKILLASKFDDALKHSGSIIQKRFSSEKELHALLKKYLGGKRIGVNFASYPHSNFLALKKILKNKKFIDISQGLGKIRAVKGTSEIKKIKEACKITLGIYRHIENFVKAGISEIEILNEINKQMIMHNCLEAYPSVVAFGENSAVPHHVPGSRKLRRGDLLLMDVGVSYQNYCSDITRCYAIGRASEAQKEIYAKVKSALDCAISSIKQNANPSALYKVAEKELGRKMPHAIGHGIGIEAHDFPSLGIKAKDLLKSNNVLAIEPAIYIPKKFGIRLEDDVIVKKGNCGRITKAPKELIEL